MLKLKRLIISILILSLIFGMSGVSYGITNQLRFGITVDEGTLTPYTYTSDPGLDLTRLIYDSLFYMNENLEPKPWLVKEYKVSDDSLVYTLKLHENVKWHDGNSLTAEDVKFTYEYFIKYKKARFTNPASTVKEIKIIDPLTIEMVLETPKPDFLTSPLAEVPILPKHIWEINEIPDESIDRIGSGPYKLTDIKAGEFYKLEANKDFYKGTPTVEKIIVPIIKDTTSLFTALKAGQIDVANRNISPEILSDFKNDKNLKIIEGPGYGSTLLQFNNERYPFTIKEFRQALTYAIDKKEIVDVIMLKSATLGTTGFLHPTLDTYNSNTKQYEFSLDAANGLLDSLNFKDTDGDSIRETDTGVKLQFNLLVYANNPQRIRIAEFIKDYYSNIGIDIIIKAMDMSTVDDLVWPEFDVTKGRDFDMTLWGWGASMMNKPSNLADMFYSDLNIGYVNIGAYKNEEFDALVDKLSLEYDNDKRKEILFDMQSIISEDSPIVTLYYPIDAYGYNPNIYDGWKFTKGKGILSVVSLVNLEEKPNEAVPVTSTPKVEVEPAQPVETAVTNEAEKAGGNTLLILGLVAVAAVVFMIIGKNKKGSKGPKS